MVKDRPAPECRACALSQHVRWFSGIFPNFSTISLHRSIQRPTEVFMAFCVLSSGSNFLINTDKYQVTNAAARCGTAVRRKSMRIVMPLCQGTVVAHYRGAAHPWSSTLQREHLRPGTTSCHLAARRCNCPFARMLAQCPWQMYPSGSWYATFLGCPAVAFTVTRRPRMSTLASQFLPRWSYVVMRERQRDAVPSPTVEQARASCLGVSQWIHGRQRIEGGITRVMRHLSSVRWSSLHSRVQHVVLITLSSDLELRPSRLFLWGWQPRSFDSEHTLVVGGQCVTQLALRWAAHRAEPANALFGDRPVVGDRGKIGGIFCRQHDFQWFRFICGPPRQPQTLCVSAWVCNVCALGLLLFQRFRQRIERTSTLVVPRWLGSGLFQCIAWPSCVSTCAYGPRSHWRGSHEKLPLRRMCVWEPSQVGLTQGQPGGNAVASPLVFQCHCPPFAKPCRPLAAWNLFTHSRIEHVYGTTGD